MKIMNVNSPNPHNHPLKKAQSPPHFIDEDTEAQRRYQQAAELGLTASQSTRLQMLGS